MEAKAREARVVETKGEREKRRTRRETRRKGVEKEKRKKKEKRKDNGSKEGSRRIGDLGWEGRSSKVRRESKNVGTGKIL